MQGTASVVLAGVIAAMKAIDGKLADQTFLFLGAGEVCLFIWSSGSLNLSQYIYAEYKMEWCVFQENIAIRILAFFAGVIFQDFTYCSFRLFSPPITVDFIAHFLIYIFSLDNEGGNRNRRAYST